MKHYHTPSQADFARSLSRCRGGSSPIHGQCRPSRYTHFAGLLHANDVSPNHKAQLLGEDDVSAALVHDSSFRVRGRKNFCKGNSTYSRSPLHGFTLVEMLVVIAIIGILAALVMPTLRSSLDSARQASCLNNLRQIYTGTLMYSNDHAGWLPYSLSEGEFAFYINAYVEQQGACYNTGGRLRFSSPVGVYYCPSVSMPAESSPSFQGCIGGSAVGTSYTSSYAPTIAQSTNPRSGCWTARQSGTWVSIQRRIATVKPNSVIMTDKNWTSVGWGFFRSGWSVGGTNTARTNNYQIEGVNGLYAPGWNHGISATFLFVDGRVRVRAYNGTSLFDLDYVPVE